MLAVSDDGCGMEKEIQENLFEPFFTTKETGKGTGLGLSTIYGIVKQNNGFINVYSEPGTGTTFTIYLPRHKTEKDSDIPENTSPEYMPTGSETILLVEDETPILRMARATLEKLGYTVCTAESPKHALELAKKYNGKINLLITDVVMPEMSGHDLALRLAANNPDLKTLYMSGYAADVVSHHGILNEDVLFMQKPFSIRDLAKNVRKAIEQK
jgi:CheY-like chemotaxis protein